MKTEKQLIEEILKQNKIVSRVKISENRIDVKYEKDFQKAKELFPKMAIAYGFIN